MLDEKARYFYGKLLRNRPLELPSMIARRLREVVSTPPKGLARTRFGSVIFDVDTTLHALARKYYFKTHEMFMDSVIGRFAKPGTIFIDVGANMGYWSAFALDKIGPTGEIYAFEPIPAFFENVERLKTNNPSRRVFANNQACGAHNGEITMDVVEPTEDNYDNFNVNIGSSSALPHFLDHAKSLTKPIKVKVVRLDDYIEDMKIDIEKIGIIKIDVEGYEAYCFDGMKNILGKPGKKVPIVCEILNDPARLAELDGRKIISRLQDCGYTILDATTLRPIDVHSMMYEENIVCV